MFIKSLHMCLERKVSVLKLKHEFSEIHRHEKAFNWLHILYIAVNVKFSSFPCMQVLYSRLMIFNLGL